MRELISKVNPNRRYITHTAPRGASPPAPPQSRPGLTGRTGVGQLQTSLRSRPSLPATGLRYARQKLAFCCVLNLEHNTTNSTLRQIPSCSINNNLHLKSTSNKSALAPNSLLGYSIKPTKLEHSSNLATGTGFVNISAGLS